MRQVAPARQRPGVDRGTRFALLLTKFTAVEELVGPVSLAALKADKYLRVTTGKLPEADYAFLDELFKGSSAILNVMLRILNERTFDAGDGVARPVPLRLCLAASNEWPSPDTGRNWPRSPTGSCCGRPCPRSGPRSAGGSCCGRGTTPPSCRPPSPRARSTRPGGGPRPCRGRPTPARPWKPSSRNSRRRASSPGTGGSSRRSGWSGRSRT
ncbi:AAA family ATPase [Fimbriiglobus ruber]|uniref:AAA family ATPase n=1 Tax=Fimbriiglobus ruber TaxID=1908690 RepID=UPI000B4AFD62